MIFGVLRGYNLVTAGKDANLVNLEQFYRPGWFTVLEWVKKTEYQGRGTEHSHIAAWVMAHVVLRCLAGNKKTVQVMTCLLRYPGHLNLPDTQLSNRLRVI